MSLVSLLSRSFRMGASVGLLVGGLTWVEMSPAHAQGTSWRGPRSTSVTVGYTSQHQQSSVMHGVTPPLAHLPNPYEAGWPGRPSAGPAIVPLRPGIGDQCGPNPNHGLLGIIHAADRFRDRVRDLQDEIEDEVSDCVGGADLHRSVMIVARQATDFHRLVANQRDMHRVDQCFTDMSKNWDLLCRYIRHRVRERDVLRRLHEADESFLALDQSVMALLRGGPALIPHGPPHHGNDGVTGPVVPPPHHAPVSWGPMSERLCSQADGLANQVLQQERCPQLRRLAMDLDFATDRFRDQCGRMQCPKALWNTYEPIVGLVDQLQARIEVTQVTTPVRRAWDQFSQWENRVRVTLRSERQSALDHADNAPGIGYGIAPSEAAYRSRDLVMTKLH